LTSFSDWPRESKPVTATSHSMESVPEADRAHMTDLVKRLRSAGISEDMLPDVIAGLVQHEWRERYVEWRRRVRNGEVDPRMYSIETARHEREREQLMRSVLGDAAFEKWDRQQVFGWMDLSELGLTEEESVALYRLQKQQQISSRELSQAQQMGEVDPTDVNVMRQQSQKEFEEKLLALLGSDRFQQWKAQSGNVLGNLRWQLRDLNLPVSQLAALARADVMMRERQSEISRLTQTGDLKNEDSSRQYQQIQQDRDAEYQRVLGEAGYAEYKKLQDYRYQQMKQYAVAWQLSPADINHVYDTVQNYNKGAEQYRKQAQELAQQGHQVDWAAVEAEIKNYSQQSANALRTFLGEERFKKMKRAGVIQIPD
jgi:hypothetical protein